MAENYLLAIAAGSSLDVSTNNYSLFSLIEQVGVLRLPAPLPFEIHTYWQFSPEEVDNDFELRVVLIAPDGGEQTGRTIDLRSDSARVRLRIQGFPDIRPQVVGLHRLRVEIRQRGTLPWARSPAFCPLQVELATAPEFARGPGTGAVPPAPA